MLRKPLTKFIMHLWFKKKKKKTLQKVGIEGTQLMLIQVLKQILKKFWNKVEESEWIGSELWPASQYHYILHWTPLRTYSNFSCSIEWNDTRAVPFLLFSCRRCKTWILSWEKIWISQNWRQFYKITGLEFWHPSNTGLIEWVGKCSFPFILIHFKCVYGELVCFELNIW